MLEANNSLSEKTPPHDKKKQLTRKNTNHIHKHH